MQTYRYPLAYAICPGTPAEVDVAGTATNCAVEMIDPVFVILLTSFPPKS
jgi:hypothetical protein